MRMRNALMAATILAAPFAAIGSATAQPVSGFYIGAGAGGNYLEETKIKSFTVVPTFNNPAGAAFVNPSNNGKINTNWGFVGLGSIGYGFGNGLRIEGEGNYRQNSIRAITGTTFPTHAGGDVQQYGGMANILYDFDLASFGIDAGGLMPYIGGGVGYSETRLRGLRQFTTNGNALATATGNPSEGSFAYQGIAGLALPIPDVPGLAITAEYRFMGNTGGESFPYHTQSAGGGFPTTNFTGKFKLEDEFNHAVLLGVRYNFGVAPAPVEPQAIIPPPIGHSYLVFFDWDRADLTGRARQIIAQAAQNSTKVSYTRMEVNGYTDSSGTAAYNQRLSVRRAQAVAAELVRDGVPRQAIAIQGFGETHQLVPTADGVREPQNRRVEIIIR